MEEKKDMVSVPYFIYEGERCRNERITKILIVSLVISVVLLFLSNALWLYAWTQYDYSSEEVTYSQDGEGLNNINTGRQGGVRFGQRLTIKTRRRTKKGGSKGTKVRRNRRR